jgi:DNA-binding NarL/FixJ family response regulator
MRGWLSHERGANEAIRIARRAKASADGRDTPVKWALLVEDHAVFREALAAVLEEYTDLEKTVQAGSLPEARRIWGQTTGEVDLVVVDLDLPNGEGISLIDNLREIEPDVPVLALTNARNLEQRARALQAGADEVLSTASSADKIVGVVQRLVGR